jgi:hypothetical protein
LAAAELTTDERDFRVRVPMTCGFAMYAFAYLFNARDGQFVSDHLLKQILCQAYRDVRASHIGHLVAFLTPGPGRAEPRAG